MRDGIFLFVCTKRSVRAPLLDSFDSKQWSPEHRVPSSITQSHIRGVKIKIIVYILCVTENGISYTADGPRIYGPQLPEFVRVKLRGVPL